MLYMMYPTKVKEVAQEIIKASNDYKSRKIDNAMIRDVVLYYATQYPELLFNANDLNPTIKILIGKQRIKLVNDLLEGHQLKINL